MGEMEEEMEIGEMWEMDVVCWCYVAFAGFEWRPSAVQVEVAY